MANQEDSACEVPHKRPRLDGIETEDQVNQEVDKVDKQLSKNNSEAKYVATVSTNPENDPERPEQKNESVMSNNGSSSGEANKASALDNSDSDNWSDISDLSGMSEDAWKPIAGPISWVQHQMTLGHNPREILQDLVTADTVIPPDLDDFTMWKIIINLMSEPPKRKKLHHINTLDDVLDLLKTCKKIMVLTGAGVSVSCGIPDFRSRNGIYARLAVDFPDLPDPQAMFDIRYFKNDPRPFFKFAKEIYPGQFEPSRCHKFIQLIEEHKKLLRNYTQNIDTLEQVAGISNVIQCHGSFAGATCMVCRHKVTAEDVKEDIFNQIIPACPVCPPDSPMSILKPDIVFFGESLPDEFHRQMAEDKDECDLLIVIGSSLKVRPVALIPNSLPSKVPQILINREPLPHMNFDVELLGDCDIIISELCKRLGEGWSHLGDSNPPLCQIKRTDLATPLSLSVSASQDDTTAASKETLSAATVSSEKTSVESKNIPQESLKSETLPNSSSKDSKPQTSFEDTSKETSKSQDNVKETLKSQDKKNMCSTSSENTAKETQKSEVDVNFEVIAKVNLKSENAVKETVSQDTAKGSLKSANTVKETLLEDTAKDSSKSLYEDSAKECSSKESAVQQSSDNFNGHASATKANSQTLTDKPEVSGASCVTKVNENGSNKDKPLMEPGDINVSANSAPSNSSLQEMRKMWHLHERQSVAKRLKDNEFLFLPPCRYVFHGAEVTNIEYESEESDQDSLVSESRDLHTSQCGDEAGDGDGDTTLSHPHTDNGKGEGAADIKMFEGSSIADVVQETLSLT